MEPTMPSATRRSFLAVSAAAAATPLLGARTFARVAPLALQDGGERSKIGKTPRTKFAINAEMWFHGVPFLQKLERIAALGFPAFEMWPWRGRDFTLDQLKAKTQELGLVQTQMTAWGFEPGMNDPKNHDAAVKEIEASCEAANFLGVKLLCVVGGNDQPGMTQEQMHENIVTCLKRAAPIAEKRGVTLMLEPMNVRVDHKGHCLYGSPPTLKIVRAVNSPNVKIMWDLYHMHISEGDLCGHMKEGIDQIAYFQLADHPGRHEPGTGEIHYNRVLKEAWDLGFRGYVGAECTPEGGDDVRAAKRLAAADVW
jgi:hydroxypyruvate isomerase